MLIFAVSLELITLFGTLNSILMRRRFFSWDDTSFYYAVSAQAVQNQAPNTFVVLYVDSDPHVLLTTGNGTTEGLQFNSQKPVLGFNADVFISWKLDDSFAEIRQFTGGTNYCQIIFQRIFCTGFDLFNPCSKRFVYRI